MNRKALIGARFVAAFTCAVALSVQSQVLSESEIQQFEQLQQTTLESPLSYDIVESLTTEVGARMVGSAGEALSVAWAVEKMKSLGFDKVWTEESKTSSWVRGDIEVGIVSPYPQPLVALALGGSVGTDGNNLSAEVVQFASLAELQAAEDGSLRHKIAFVSFQMERHIDGRGYRFAVGARVYGASVAAKKGAIAFVMRSVGTDTNRNAHTGSMTYTEGVKKIPALALSNPDADLLVNQLRRGEPVVLSVKLDAQRNEQMNHTISNVIGEITGTDSPDEFVILGAHLDSWDVGTGAIDDGVGVGITLAAAHHISQLKTRPRRSIRVILFAAEEVGLLGAKAYVERHKEEMDKHVVGSEWDFGTGNIYEMRSGVGPSALNAVRELAALLAPLGVSLSPENNAKGQSDMSALGAAGQPAIDFSPDGSTYFDYHHTQNDTLDKVDRASLKHNTAVYTLFAYFAAQSGVDFRK